MHNVDAALLSSFKLNQLHSKTEAVHYSDSWLLVAKLSIDSQPDLFTRLSLYSLLIVTPWLRN